MQQESVSHFASSLPGRIRIRDKRLRNASLLTQLEDELRQMSALQHIEGNSVAGSIIIRYDPAKASQDDVESTVDAKFEAFLASQAPVHATRKQLNRYTKIGMLGSLGTSLALVAAGSKRGHAVAGGLFLAALALHLNTHRRQILR